MRVFCCSYQNYALDAVQMLARSHGWTPVYFQTTPAIDAAVGSAFPGAVRHNYLDAVKGRPAAKFRDAGANANSEVIDLLRAQGRLATALKMFDRNQSVEVPMDEAERMSLIEWFSGYWTEVLASLKVDLVIFEEVPHQVTDFVLYACAERLGIRRLVPIRTLPRAGYLLSDSYDSFTLAPRAGEYRVSAKYQPLTQYAMLMRGAYTNYAQTMFFDAPDTLRLFSVPEPAAARPNRAAELWSRAARIVEGARLVVRFGNDRKERGKSLPQSRQGFLAHRRGMQATVATKLELRAIYEGRAASGANRDAPYVFCALQYQPEASTCPKGGPFVDQLRMVQLLLAVLPEGWRLAVKEHPNQFSPKYARFAETARSQAFYDELTRDPRVDLISLSTPSFDLVDGAMAVASVGGTICLEAAVRGKPSFNFGTAFFDTVHGILKIIDIASGQSAMNTVAGGFLPHADEVMSDLQKIDNACYPGAIGGPVTLEEIGLTQTENAQVHAKSWLEWLEANPWPARR